MSQINLEEHLESIVGRPGKETESVNLRLALSQYPELQGFRYDGQILYISQEINFYADHVDIKVRDGEIVVLPYIEDKGFRLHCLPAVYHVAYVNHWGFGYVPYAKWEEQFEQNGFDRKILLKIKDFLGQHAPADYLS